MKGIEGTVPYGVEKDRRTDKLDVDMVNQPPHYTFGTIEVIEVIEEEKK